ncbi:hypothetical protein SAMN05421857_0097 [Chryseobacterium formosense]|nr:hypothetical protein SAMN05421857_0097 [Chryseobacterium formosense]
MPRSENLTKFVFLCTLQPGLNGALFAKQSVAKKREWKTEIAAIKIKKAHEQYRKAFIIRKLETSCFQLPAILFYSFKVRTVFCAHFDFVSRLDEQRNHYSCSCLNDCIFQSICCCISFYSRICFYNFKIN